MGVTVTENIFNAFLSIACLIVSIRAFYLYSNVFSPLIFIFGLSMGMMALTAGSTLLMSYVTVVQLNMLWFLFFGQGVSLFFILLSLLPVMKGNLPRLMRIHIVVSIMLLGLLLASPVLPFKPIVAVILPVSVMRVVICFLVFYCYVGIFARKPTVFSFLMCMAYMLLSFGFLLRLTPYFISHADLLIYISQCMRIVGVGTLLAGFYKG